MDRLVAVGTRERVAERRHNSGLTQLIFQNVPPAGPPTETFRQKNGEANDFFFFSLILPLLFLVAAFAEP